MSQIKIFQKNFNSVEDIQNQFRLFRIKSKTSIKDNGKAQLTKSSTKSKDKSSSGSFREFIAKLSRGLMLPIAMLPIAGLFLGIGSAIVTQAGDNAGLVLFGNILKIPGNAIFSNLPVLFCIAIAITFAHDAGAAGLSAFVGWIIFCALQSALIMSKTNDAGVTTEVHFLWYNYYLDNTLIKAKFLDFDMTTFNAIFGQNVGIKSLTTSIFGGICVGWGVSLLYNRYKNIQLPQMLSFFSGVRFIPIISFFAMILLSLIFAIVWPMIGNGLYLLGKVLGDVPYGINSLIFGYIERALVPFGLHHAFYIPLWQTAAGGTMSLENADAFKNLLDHLNTTSISIDGKQITSWLELVKQFGYADSNPTTIQGDQNCWAFINGYIAGHSVTLANETIRVLTFGDIKDCFDGVNPGQYMQGKYPFMMFGLPAAAAGMILAAPKGDGRKLAMSTIVGSAGTTFLTGITEPLEFTFLFLAPLLYYGFHAVLCAISFWLMNWCGAHIGMTFSAGAIDFVIYGAIGDAICSGTKCWIAILIGLGLSPIYFFGFWWYIVKKDVKTPGREGGITRLMTKQDYLNNKNKNAKVEAKVSNKQGAQDSLAEQVIKAYGGKNNIVNVDACITKLRIQVVDPNKVNKDQLMKLGARGVIRPSKQSVYAVFGTKADIIKNQMKDILDN